MVTTKVLCFCCVYKNILTSLKFVLEAIIYGEKMTLFNMHFQWIIHFHFLIKKKYIGFIILYRKIFSLIIFYIKYIMWVESSLSSCHSICYKDFMLIVKAFNGDLCLKIFLLEVIFLETNKLLY